MSKQLKNQLRELSARIRNLPIGRYDTGYEEKHDIAEELYNLTLPEKCGAVKKSED